MLKKKTLPFIVACCFALDNDTDKSLWPAKAGHFVVDTVNCHSFAFHLQGTSAVWANQKTSFCPKGSD